MNDDEYLAFIMNNFLSFLDDVNENFLPVLEREDYEP